MRDYMRALYLRFGDPSKQTKEMSEEVNRLHRQLAEKLEKPERKLLLRISDMEDALRDQTNLESFMSGFRVANGIHQELAEKPPYSFAAEDERKACELHAKEQES